jgi:hypothetical protein
MPLKIVFALYWSHPGQLLSFRLQVSVASDECKFGKDKQEEYEPKHKSSKGVPHVAYGLSCSGGKLDTHHLPRAVAFICNFRFQALARTRWALAVTRFRGIADEGRAATASVGSQPAVKLGPGWTARCRRPAGGDGRLAAGLPLLRAWGRVAGPQSSQRQESRRSRRSCPSGSARSGLAQDQGPSKRRPGGAWPHAGLLIWCYNQKYNWHGNRDSGERRGNGIGVES